MNRRGFFGRMVGAVTAAVVGRKVVDGAESAPAGASTWVGAAEPNWRAVVGPTQAPTFKEAYEAAKRGEVWVSPGEVHSVLTVEQVATREKERAKAAAITRQREADNLARAQVLREIEMAEYRRSITGRLNARWMSGRTLQEDYARLYGYKPKV